MDNKENSNKKIVTGVFWKFAERIGAQGVSFIVSLVLARLLMPEDYGAVAVVLVFIEIANVFLTSGLSTALIQKKDITQLETSTIFYCNLLLSIALYGVMYASAPLIAKLYELPILVSVTRVFALRLPISAFQAIQSAIVSRNLDFRKLFLCTLSGTVCSAVVGIIMAVKGYGVWALVAQSIVGELINTIILGISIRWVPSLKFSLRTVKPMISYGWKVMVTDLIGTIFNNLSSMIIGVKYTTTDLAYYTKGKHIPHLIYSNISAVLLGVLFPAMAKSSDDPAGMKRVAKQSIRMIYYVLAPCMVGMMAVSENLVLFLFTEKWAQMTPFVCIVCVECLFVLAPSISLQTLRAAGRGDMMLKLEFYKKPLYLLLILVAMRFGVFAVALAASANGVLELILNGIYIKKVVDYSAWEQVCDCLPAILVSALMGFAVVLVGRLQLPLILALVVQVLTGVVVYVLLSMLFKIPEFGLVKRLVISKLPRKNKAN